MSRNPATTGSGEIKRPPKVSEWRALVRIEEFNHAALIEWLVTYGGDLEVQLFEMNRQDLVDLMNQHGRTIPPNLMGIKDWLAPLDKGARLETWQFASENLGGRFPFREHCKSDAKIRQNCEYAEDCGKESGRCWWSYVKSLWRIARAVAHGHIPSEDNWKSIELMKEKFVSKPRRTHRTRTDEEANFAQHVFYIDDPSDIIEQTGWSKIGLISTQYSIKSTYRCQPHETLWPNDRRKISEGIISSCPDGGYLKMAKIEDIVDAAITEDPKSHLRNLNHYELASAEIEWISCPERAPEKGEIQPGGDAGSDKVGKDDCYIWVGGKYYSILDDPLFEKEFHKWKSGPWEPPSQCLDLLRDVYDEEFFDYVKLFRRKYGPPGSLIAGKLMKYPEDFQPEFSSEFCYFGRRPRFCSKFPCPIFSNEDYSFNEEHTKKFLATWPDDMVRSLKSPKILEYHPMRLCTKVANHLLPRREKDEVIRDMGFPVLHAALNGLLREIKTLTETSKNTCAYCGGLVERGREYCPSTVRRDCYDAYYNEVKRTELKPIVSTGDRGVVLSD